MSQEGKVNCNSRSAGNHGCRYYSVKSESLHAFVKGSMCEFEVSMFLLLPECSVSLGVFGYSLAVSVDSFAFAALQKRMLKMFRFHCWANWRTFHSIVRTKQSVPRVSRRSVPCAAIPDHVSISEARAETRPLFLPEASVSVLHARRLFGC
jgi:hypothetical protein